MKINLLRYHGVNRNGTAKTGTADAFENTPLWLAQQLYNEGWRQLTISRNLDHDEVGGIKIIAGKRNWWGECF
jgi:hypothetical protein